MAGPTGHPSHLGELEGDSSGQQSGSASLPLPSSSSQSPAPCSFTPGAKGACAGLAQQPTMAMPPYCQLPYPYNVPIIQKKNIWIILFHFFVNKVLSRST